MGAERDETGSGADAAEPPARPTKRARAKSAALWGLVGGFTFLVAIQGYRLVSAGGLPVGIGGTVLIAVAVAAVVTAIAYALEHRLRAKRRV
jgi:hypothetical protein